MVCELLASILIRYCCHAPEVGIATCFREPVSNFSITLGVRLTTGVPVLNNPE